MNKYTSPQWQETLLGGGLCLLLLTVYWLAGTVYISKPSLDMVRAGGISGVQDQFVGLDCFSTNDSTAVIAQSLSLLNEGNLSLSPKEIPQMVHWQIQGLEHFAPFSLAAVDARLASWMDGGTLHPMRGDSERHIRSVHPQIAPTNSPNLYLSCFGVGAALTSAPAFAVAQAWYGRLDRLPDVLDRVAFAEGSILVAVSGMFLYLALRRQLPPVQSGTLVLAYGLGTCVFSTSSQGLWQHSATAFYLSIGLWCLSRWEKRAGVTILLGVALAMATLSRPTLGLFAAAVAVWLAIVDRKSCLRYVLAGLPFAALLLAFNAYYLGSPFRFGQTVLVDHAFEKTGVASIWQTPVWIGLAGLLFSPSRGLFVYSPFLLASIPGLFLCWSGQRWSWLRPVSVAVPLILFVESMHFDWWGGWSFGYRHLVDVSPMLVALIGPAAHKVFHRRWILPFSAAVAWSIAVQVIGVTANDVCGWNARIAFRLRDASETEVGRTFDEKEYTAWNRKIRRTPRVDDLVSLNIDQPEHRHRLWSIRDSQLVYCLQNFASGAASRQSQMLNARQDWSRKLAESYAQLARVYLQARQFELARACLDWALAADPGCQQAMVLLWEVFPPDELALRFRQRVVQAPDDMAAWTYLGFACAEQGDVEQAVRAFSEIQRKSSTEFARRYDSFRRYIDLLRVHGGLASRPAARQDLSNVASILDCYDRGRKYEEQGRWNDAERAFREAQAIMPGLLDTKAHLARVRALRNANASGSRATPSSQEVK